MKVKSVEGSHEKPCVEQLRCQFKSVTIGVANQHNADRQQKKNGVTNLSAERNNGCTV